MKKARLSSRAFLLVCEINFAINNTNQSFNLKTLSFQIAVISAFDCREFQHAIIGVRHAAFVEHCVAALPKHIFALLIRQNLHFANQHYPLVSDEPLVVEIDACVRVCLILPHPHRRSVSRKPEFPKAIMLSRLQHCLDVREVIAVNRCDKTYLLSVDELF